MYTGGEQEADFAHVSRVFGRMLSARRYVDVVATDIAAGLILLRHVQKAEVGRSVGRSAAWLAGSLLGRYVDRTAGWGGGGSG